MTEATLARLETVQTGSLLPNEVVVSIGCAGCTAACAGTYRMRGDRAQRDTFVGDVAEALELGEVEGTITRGGRVQTFEGDCSDTANCPASDADVSGIIDQALKV